ncbi:family S53 protease [Myriangium duriaei CBS 260.36]|uniref:tripeptidyl-peptidase II n=1 Tax=Myriangium duriaei CBS 260.36 TaxID=1168546 RepID=A0A9P4MBV2_9PEZI|nr:family S53 protease [Myriangium duriaei CBS 260.36]
MVGFPSFLLSSFIAIAAARSLENLVEHERIAKLPWGWTTHSTAQDDEPVSLRIALSHPHTNYLNVARDVSDPTSPNHGQYLSREDLKAILPNISTAASEVTSWLHTNSIHSSTLGDYVHFNTTVSKAKSLLRADFRYYQHKESDPVLRTEAYRIPRTLSHHIDYIYPTVHFIKPMTLDATRKLQARQHIPTGPVTCSDSVCPSQLAIKYNITYHPKDATSGSRIAVGGFLEQYPDHSDVKKFIKSYAVGKHNADYDYSTTLVNGGKDVNIASKAGAEALLDLEYTMGIANPLPVTYFSTGGRPATLSQPGNKVVPTNESNNEPWLALFQHLLDMQSPPQVVSLSYTDDEQTVPPAFAKRVCNLAALLAARGVSIIVASGDGGASGTAADECKGPDGKRRFIPTFPPSCPWVTSVGATDAADQGAHYSGGGFSNYFPVPAWQSGAVSQYQRGLNGKHKGWYNATGRGFPDVTLLGDNYLTFGNNYTYPQKGTSASTPVFAAMVALINDKRLREGKPVLGFLNQRLYNATVQKAFRDVLEGQIDGCSFGNTFEEGFVAAKGWDPVSGLGQPNFVKLLEVLG